MPARGVFFRLQSERHSSNVDYDCCPLGTHLVTDSVGAFVDMHGETLSPDSAEPSRHGACARHTNFDGDSHDLRAGLHHAVYRPVSSGASWEDLGIYSPHIVACLGVPGLLACVQLCTRVCVETAARIGAMQGITQEQTVVHVVLPFKFVALALIVYAHVSTRTVYLQTHIRCARLVPIHHCHKLPCSSLCQSTKACTTPPHGRNAAVRHASKRSKQSWHPEQHHQETRWQNAPCDSSAHPSKSEHKFSPDRSPSWHHEATSASGWHHKESIFSAEAPSQEEQHIHHVSSKSSWSHKDDSLPSWHQEANRASRWHHKDSRCSADDPSQQERNIPVHKRSNDRPSCFGEMQSQEQWHAADRTKGLTDQADRCSAIFQEQHVQRAHSIHREKRNIFLSVRAPVKTSVHSSIRCDVQHATQTFSCGEVLHNRDVAFAIPGLFRPGFLNSITTCRRLLPFTQPPQLFFPAVRVVSLRLLRASTCTSMVQVAVRCTRRLRGPSWCSLSMRMVPPRLAGIWAPASSPLHGSRVTWASTLPLRILPSCRPRLGPLCGSCSFSSGSVAPLSRRALPFRICLRRVAGCVFCFAWFVRVRARLQSNA